MTTDTILGDWVEIQTEPRRGKRSSTVAVNRRDGTALLLDDDELEQLATAGDPDRELVEVLGARGFLAATAPPVKPPTSGRLVRFLRQFDIHWTGAHRHIELLHERWFRRAWHRRWIVFQLALGAAGIVAFVAVIRSGRTLELRPEPWQIPIYIVLSLVAVAIHELAHGLVIARHGRRVASVGFRLHLGSPAFYVESVEALLLPRRQRIVQAAAGPWAEWLFTSLVALVLWLAPTGDLTSILHRFVLLTAFTIASNLLPFAGLDGALIFADVIREPNLATESKDAVDRLGIDRRPGDGPLVAYAVVNTVVSAGLLVTAVWFWFELFGGVLGRLFSHGPIGWAAALTLVMLSFGPSVFAAVPHLRRWSPIDRIAFRLERRARIRLAGLFADVGPFSELDGRSLGVLAGQLRLRTVRRWGPLHEAEFAGHVAVDGPADLGRDGKLPEAGVVAIGGPGLVATTQRRLRRVRVGLLPRSSMQVVVVDAAAHSGRAGDALPRAADPSQRAQEPTRGRT